MTDSATHRPVIFDHDGALDDLLALLLLTRYDVDLRGVCVTPGDCLLQPAMSASRKILDLAGLATVPVAGNDLTGRNPFPLQWRVDALRVDALPMLNRSDPDQAVWGDRDDLAGWLRQAPHPVTVLSTGPLANLADCLQHHPDLADRIAELVVMGGALDVPGNVDQPGHDGTAEWNFYWDPQAAQQIFNTRIPITLIPLDVTNQVPVTDQLARAFGAQPVNPTTDLAGTLLAMTFGTIETTGLPYCCWDSLAAAYLAQPSLFTLEAVRCTVTTTGPSQGQLTKTDDGRLLRSATAVNAERFYAHCIASLTDGP